MARKQPADKAEKPVVSSGTLDRSKTFYEVIGGGAVKFQQGDDLFDINGNQVDLDGNPVAGAVVEKEPEPEVVADAQVAPEKTNAETAAGMTEDELAALSGGK